MGQYSRHGGGRDAASSGTAGTSSDARFRGDGRSGSHEQLSGLGDDGAVDPHACGEQPGGLARRLGPRASAVVEAWQEVDERGEQRRVGRLRVLPPSAGQGQFRGVANFGRFGGHPSDFGGRAFDPEGRGAELGIESGVEPGRGPPGFGDPGASDLAQLRSSLVRLGRDRQPADRAARLRRWHGLGVGGELIGPGQDGNMMPLPGRLGGSAGLGGERPFLPGRSSASSALASAAVAAQSAASARFSIAETSVTC